MGDLIPIVFEAECNRCKGRLWRVLMVRAQPSGVLINGLVCGACGERAPVEPAQ